MVELPALNRQIAGSIPRAPTNRALSSAYRLGGGLQAAEASLFGAVNQLVEIPACHAG